jgi:hypothetical protein
MVDQPDAAHGSADPREAGESLHGSAADQNAALRFHPGVGVEAGAGIPQNTEAEDRRRAAAAQKPVGGDGLGEARGARDEAGGGGHGPSDPLRRVGRTTARMLVIEEPAKGGERQQGYSQPRAGYAA